MSVMTSAADNVRMATRRVVVMGSMASGKTTLSISASSHAGDVIGQSAVQCTDTVLLSGDQEGVIGALDAGLTPRAVVDMTTCKTWQEYQTLLAQAFGELLPLIKSKDVKFIVVDMALPAKLIIEMVAPKDIKDWGKVAAEGLKFYQVFGALRGATIIANVQIKSAIAVVETAAGAAGAEAKAIGGERATFTADLTKSIFAPWAENSSLVLSREVKRKADPMKKDAPSARHFFTHTQSNSRMEAKSRFGSKLKATEPGERTLNSLLREAYGESL